jgi:hypothetical protein
MKILHILNDGPSDLFKRIIDIQSKNHEVKVIELFKKQVSYDDVIDEVFSHDKVVSW